MLVKKSNYSDWDKTNTIPGIFPWNVMKNIYPELFSGIDDSKSVGYPTDVIELLDSGGSVNGYEIQIALAGLKRENVSVVIENDTLHITVKKQNEESDDTRRFIRKGISYRSMQIKYGLHGINREKIDAIFADGMLKVKLPLEDEVKPKQIEIK